jgi:hypothetical protein
VIVVTEAASTGEVLGARPPGAPSGWDALLLPRPGPTCDGSCAPLCDGCADFEAEEGPA